MDQLAREIEKFLLPSHQTYFAIIKNGINRLHECPLVRLDECAYEMAVAEHIRTMQTIYRDSNDDLKLFQELRLSNHLKVWTTKSLTEKLLEGRIGIAALSRICFGDGSLEMLRSNIDMASSYALQGMWPQVTEHLTSASQSLVKYLSNTKLQQLVAIKMRKARDAAVRIECTFRVLRSHALNNRGYVNSSILRDLVTEYGKLSLSWSQEHCMNEDFLNNGTIEPESLGHPSQLVIVLHQFLSQYHNTKTTAQSSTSHGHEYWPSWGEIVEFLRCDCLLMQAWMQQLEMDLMPQTKACLVLAFRACDVQDRGVSHPAELAACICRFPCAAKCCAGTTMAKQLNAMKTSVTLLVHQDSGRLLDEDSNSNQSGSEFNQVTYDLPATFEEYLSMFVMEVDSTAVLPVIHAQVLTLSSVCHIFNNRLSKAEDSMREALKQLEAAGLEMEISSCELHNSIAQLMIMKHKSWQSNKKSRLEKISHEWIEGAAGRQAIKDEMKAVKLKYRARIFRLTNLEVEYRARQRVFKKHMKHLMAVEEDPTLKAVEAAFRYLVRSFEILESVHGHNHPTVGTACLAVAAVKNLVGEHEIAREWLVRCLRIMERLNPLPERAVAFVQIQLSQVLFKQKHDDEGALILSKATNFHMKRAQEGLLHWTNHASECRSDNMTGEHHLLFTRMPIHRNTPLYDDVRVAMELTARVIHVAASRGDKWQAAELASEVAELAETAFGWDSVQAAEARRQLGIRAAAAQNWEKACGNLQLSLEAFELLLGKSDKRCIEIGKLLEHAMTNKAQQDKPANLHINHDQEAQAHLANTVSGRKARPLSAHMAQSSAHGNRVAEKDESDMMMNMTMGSSIPTSPLSAMDSPIAHVYSP